MAVASMFRRTFSIIRGVQRRPVRFLAICATCAMRNRNLTGLPQVIERIHSDVSSQFFGESLAVAGLLTEPPWLGQETGHSHPELLRGYIPTIGAFPGDIIPQANAHVAPIPQRVNRAV